MTYTKKDVDRFGLTLRSVYGVLLSERQYTSIRRQLLMKMKKTSSPTAQKP